MTHWSAQCRKARNQPSVASFLGGASHGRPVAVLIPPRETRPHSLSRADLIAFRDQHPVDPNFGTDLQWISAGTTDELADLT